MLFSCICCNTGLYLYGQACLEEDEALEEAIQRSLLEESDTPSAVSSSR